MDRSLSRRTWRLALAVLMTVPLAACASDSGEEADTATGTGKFPSKKMEMIVPVSPGGGWDTVSRAVADALPAHLPGAEPLTVLNNNNGLGVEQYRLVTADKSGHVLGPLTIPGIAASAASGQAVDLRKARPLGSVGEDPYVVVASKKSGLRTIDDVVKRNKVTVGSSSGRTGGDFFVNVVMSSAFGHPWEYVNHEGSSEASLAAIRGDVELITQPLSSIAKSLPDPNLVPLLVFSDERVKQLPDVPTAAETGSTKNIADLGRIYRTFFVSSDTPDDVVAALEQALAAVAKDQAFISRMSTSGSPVIYKSAKEISTVLADIVKIADQNKNQFKTAG
jgi:tripartite-type tricarboxylate transporter receptor subunit TctC